MSDVKLTYFDFSGGRGEDCRLALHLAGVPFTDDRVPGTDWGTRKAQTPWRNLPVLTVDGVELGQSNAVLTYIGRRWGLHPTDLWEAARHEAVMCTVEELRHAISCTGHADPEEKRKLREAFASGKLTDWARCVEPQIIGPFFGGDTLQVADLKVWVFLNFLAKGGLDHVLFSTLVGFPKLMGLFDAVAAAPGVQAWNAAHPS